MINTYELDRWRESIGLSACGATIQFAQRPSVELENFIRQTKAAQRYSDEISVCREKYVPLVQRMDALLAERKILLNEIMAGRIFALGPNDPPNPVTYHGTRSFLFHQAYRLGFGGKEYRWTEVEMTALCLAVGNCILGYEMAVCRLARSLLRTGGCISAGFHRYTNFGFGGAPKSSAEDSSERCFFLGDEELGEVDDPFFSAVMKEYEKVAKRQKVKPQPLRFFSKKTGEEVEVEIKIC